MITLPQELVQCRNLVGGEWLSPSDGNSIAVESPYSGEPIGYVGMSSADEVKAAVDIALRAFADWRAVPIKERTGTLLKFRELTLQRLDELANLAAAEAGKTVAEARAGVLKGVEVIEFAASLQNMDQGGALEVSRGVWCQYKREPLGVVVGITPFNFPAMVPLLSLIHI